MHIIERTRIKPTNRDQGLVHGPEHPQLALHRPVSAWPVLQRGEIVEDLHEDGLVGALGVAGDAQQVQVRDLVRVPEPDFESLAGKPREGAEDAAQVRPSGQLRLHVVLGVHQGLHAEGGVESGRF